MRALHEFKEEHREVSEKMAQKLKEELPEGYEVESEFGEDKNVFSIKIKGGEDVDESTELIKKLIEELREEQEKIKK